jgi:hypothetical protein
MMQPKVRCVTLGFGVATRLGLDCTTTKLALWAGMVTVDLCVFEV